MKKIFLFALLLECFSVLAIAQQNKSLKISENNRYLTQTDGTPFFWLGDTAWELFHRLNREEATLYLENRAAKGFNVIQAVVLAELDGVHAPNAYNEQPLVNDDPAKPNEKYFQHVDFIVNKADSLGMYIGMLPTWGDKFNKMWGVGPEIFTPKNAEIYGEFLGKRYKNKPIIWILGGDRPPGNDEDLAIIRAMAVGIAKGDGGRHLITYHPSGESSSSKWFHEDRWLNFNMLQSGHGRLNWASYKAVESDYQLNPVKPVINGEPVYEDHPIAWNAANGWFSDFDSRRDGYWSVLSGACGNTYGNQNIWQMVDKNREPVAFARTPWWQAIDQPGGFQAGYMRQLFESRPWQLLQPNQSIVKKGPNTGGKDIKSAVASDGSFLMVYTPYGSDFAISLEKLKGEEVTGWWFNPRNNTAIALRNFKKKNEMDFNPPADEIRGNDWILVLDNASAGFGEPGK